MTSQNNVLRGFKSFNDKWKGLNVQHFLPVHETAESERQRPLPRPESTRFVETFAATFARSSHLTWCKVWAKEWNQTCSVPITEIQMKTEKFFNGTCNRYSFAWQKPKNYVIAMDHFFISNVSVHANFHFCPIIIFPFMTTTNMQCFALARILHFVQTVPMFFILLQSLKTEPQKHMHFDYRNWFPVSPSLRFGGHKRFPLFFLFLSNS